MGLLLLPLHVSAVFSTALRPRSAGKKRAPTFLLECWACNIYTVEDRRSGKKKHAFNQTDNMLRTIGGIGQPLHCRIVIEAFGHICFQSTK